MKLLETLLNETIVLNEIKEFIQEFENNGFILTETSLYNKLSEIGYGGFATVYEINDSDYILRIGTSETTKRNKLNTLKLVGKKLNNVVHIYLYKNITKNNIDFEIVVMERLYPIEQLNKKFYYLLQEIIWMIDIDEFVSHVNFENYDDLKVFIEEHRSPNYVNNDIINEIISNSKLFNQIYAGLEELKFYGIVHSDLHEDNIMMDENGNIKLIDWF